MRVGVCGCVCVYVCVCKCICVSACSRVSNRCVGVVVAYDIVYI